MSEADIRPNHAGARLAVIGVLAAALVGAAIFWPSSDGDDVIDISAPVGSDELSPATGDEPAPRFEATGLKGGSIALEELAGRPVVLNFFASWCTPCIAEMPDLEAAHQAFPEVAFVGLANNDPPVEVRELVERTGVNYEIGLDPQGEIFASFEAFAMPTTVFIDAEGRIVESRGGKLDEKSLFEKVSALAGRDAAPTSE